MKRTNRTPEDLKLVLERAAAKFAKMPKAWRDIKMPNGSTQRFNVTICPPVLKPDGQLDVRSTGSTKKGGQRKGLLE